MDIMKAFARSKQGKKIVAEEERVEVAAREGMLEEIESLRAEIKAGLPALKKELTDAEDAATEAYAAHLEANLRLQQAKAASYGFSSGLDGRISSIQAALRDGADPTIAEFVGFCRGVWDQERGSWGTSHPDDPESAGLRMKQIADTQEQAEKLLLLPDPEVAARELERLKSELAGAHA